MSTFTNPTGPQPPSVYWRRRALVLLGLVVAIVVVVLIVVRPGASGDEPGAAATSTPAADPAPSAAATAPAADATPDPSSTEATAEDGARCAATAIELVPVVDKQVFAPTELPQISMSVTNTGSSDCVINLGSGQQKLVVTSGEEQWWSSADCQVDPTDQDVTLTAGQTLSTPAIAWDRTRSTTDTCDADSRQAVPAGGATYRLTVSVGDITSADTAPMILN
ncbi:hypothetical protein IFT90_00615 [Frigoribacterium sp. CFBP 8766]|jgi:hypothetical protein|uniref:hypothetical protein n=1 Tax=Frigoribacterium sp. CFBP 8766 TaxID=2775273 RepID=UPI001781D516|nr:hypothetical protein [Frigoribacterium sp. CFBP 8766]MBD8583052.1 hypothetical protein [Frigoribacterium sp. CFBP 8766]